jgi:serine/threonine protein kinase
LCNGSLFKFLRERPTELSPTQRTIIALDVAAGMAYMHEQKVIHRDLKSVNILLDDQKRARICDFGLSRVLTFEPMSGVVGTAQWMAPEVFRSDPVYATPVDVYSFGVLMWELLTSRVPFDGYNRAELPTLVVNQGLRPEIPGGTPRELAHLIQRCWAANPVDRPTFQQICQLLCSRRYAFPGTDLSVLPRVNVRHTVSASDPLTLLPVSHQGHQKSESLDPRSTLRVSDMNLVRLCEALQTNNEAGIRQTIETIHGSVRQGTAACEYLPDLLTVVNDYIGPDLVQLLDDFMTSREFFSLFLESNGVSFLCRWLESQNARIVSAVLSILESHRRVELFTIPIIRALLLLHDFRKTRLRTRALNVLLGVAQRQRHFLCSMPPFVGHLLDFAGLRIDDETWIKLLDTAADLLSGVDYLPEMVIERLAVLPSQVPDRFSPRMLRCIEITLRFRVFRENFPELVWECAVRHLPNSANIFEFFTDTPSEKMIECLVNSQNPLALNQLVGCSKSPRNAPIIATKLPIQLPCNTELLWELYLNILNTPEAGPSVYQQAQFYRLCAGKSAIDSQVCQLLRSEHVRIDIAQQSNLINLLCEACLKETEPNALWNILSVVYKWSSLGYHSEFEVLIPKLTLLLRDESPVTRLGAFLSLAPFAERCPQKVNMMAILEAAVAHMVDGSEIVQGICLKLIESNRVAIGALADTFQF